MGVSGRGGGFRSGRVDGSVRVVRSGLVEGSGGSGLGGGVRSGRV